MGVYKVRFRGQSPRGRHITTQDLFNAKSESEARFKAESKLPEVKAMLEKRDGCEVHDLQCIAIEDKTNNRR